MQYVWRNQDLLIIGHTLALFINCKIDFKVSRVYVNVMNYQLIIS